MAQLILKRASASRPSGEWNDDDCDVLAEGTVIGWPLEIMRTARDLRLCETREAAMIAFGKSWRRE
jgi:hypothetical protein